MKEGRQKGRKESGEDPRRDVVEWSPLTSGDALVDRL